MELLSKQKDQDKESQKHHNNEDRVHKNNFNNNYSRGKNHNNNNNDNLFSFYNYYNYYSSKPLPYKSYQQNHQHQKHQQQPKYQKNQQQLVTLNYNPNYLQEQILYRTEMYIALKYPHLIDINKRNSKIFKKINENSKFFVIKSLTEEDIHKSIKYEVWCTSRLGNFTLNNAFYSTRQKGGNVYLLFSCNGSGRFVGIAKMKTGCDKNKSFHLWTQDNKWIGLFGVEWLLIKDVPLKEFNSIIIRMKDGEIRPISYARNTQEIPYQQAKVIIEKINKYQNSNTILEHFELYDIRQESYEHNLKKKYLEKFQKNNRYYVKTYY